MAKAREPLHTDQAIRQANARLHFTDWAMNATGLLTIDQYVLVRLAWEADEHGRVTRLPLGRMKRWSGAILPETVLLRLQAGKWVLYEIVHGYVSLGLNAPPPPNGPLPLPSWNHLSLSPLSPLPQRSETIAPPPPDVQDSPLPSLTQPAAADAAMDETGPVPVWAPAHATSHASHALTQPPRPASPTRAAAAKVPQPWDEFPMPGVWRFYSPEKQRQAWNLVCAYYAATDRTLHDMTDFIRRRELKIALDLVQAGVTAQEAQHFVAWTKAEPYRPQAASLQTLEKHLATFRMPASRPATQARPASMGSVFDLVEPE